MRTSLLIATAVLALPIAACAQNGTSTTPSTASTATDTTTSTGTANGMAPTGSASTDTMTSTDSSMSSATTGTMGSTGMTGATPAGASTTLAAGATVYDAQGGVIGTVDSMTGDMVVVNTGTNRVSIARSSFGTGANGPTLGTTKAQLDAQAGQATAASAASLDSSLTAGAQVYGMGGSSVGTVKAMDGEFVTVTTTKGDVRLPKTGFAVRNNQLTIGMTAAQLEAAIPSK